LVKRKCCQILVFQPSSTGIVNVNPCVINSDKDHEDTPNMMLCCLSDLGTWPLQARFSLYSIRHKVSTTYFDPMILHQSISHVLLQKHALEQRDQEHSNRHRCQLACHQPISRGLVVAIKCNAEERKMAERTNSGSSTC